MAYGYTVKAGDTLSKIATSQGVTLAALRAANPQITNPNVIRVGQVIQIPNGGGGASGGSSGSAAYDALASLFRWGAPAPAQGATQATQREALVRSKLGLTPVPGTNGERVYDKFTGQPRRLTDDEWRRAFVLASSGRGYHASDDPNYRAPGSSSGITGWLLDLITPAAVAIGGGTPRAGGSAGNAAAGARPGGSFAVPGGQQVHFVWKAPAAAGLTQSWSTAQARLKSKLESLGFTSVNVSWELSGGVGKLYSVVVRAGSPPGVTDRAVLSNLLVSSASEIFNVDEESATLDTSGAGDPEGFWNKYGTWIVVGGVVVLAWKLFD